MGCLGCFTVLSLAKARLFSLLFLYSTEYGLFVKTLIQMSPKYYDLLLSKIDEDSPQYSLLKNAVIIDQSPIGVLRKTIDILCEIEQAEHLRLVAKRFCIEAASEIEVAIILHRRLGK
jgi:hypothetical protein